MPTSREKRFQNKVVVITGASAGLGRATVREFAEEGAKLALIARGERGLRGAKRDAEERGAKALVFPLDVSNYHDLKKAADEIEKDLGPIDVWVNNAMLSVFAPVQEVKPEEFKRVTEVTYLGYVYGTKIALDFMLKRNHGTIVQVGSALAHRSIPLQSAYCAGKHAVQGFTESLRTELLHDGSNVKITIVQMPALNTPQFEWVQTTLPKHPQPVPPIYQPEVGARALVHAALNPKKEYWLGFSTMKAVLGEKFASDFADHYLARNGYSSQQMQDLPLDPDRRTNLWNPVDDVQDLGAHGRFDARASDKSMQWWLSSHRIEVASGAFGMGVFLAAAVAVALATV